MADTAVDKRSFRAVHRFAPISARKARYVVDLVRGLPVNEALERLQMSPRRAAPMVAKVLRSAIANATQDLDIDVNRLYVSDARGDDGPTLKRGKARSRGQYFAILVRYCHISIEVTEAPEDGIPGRKPKRDRSGKKKRRATGKPKRAAAADEATAPETAVEAVEETPVDEAPDAAAADATEAQTEGDASEVDASESDETRTES